MTRSIEVPQVNGRLLDVELHKTGVLEVKPRVEMPQRVKTAVFVDAGNLWGTIAGLPIPPDKKFSLSKLFNWISNDGVDPISINYYVYNQEISNDLFRYLTSVNATIIFVPDKIINGKRKEGPVDHAITADMIYTMGMYDEAVLISGDGDFGRPVEILMKEGKRVRVVSGKGSVGAELISLEAEIVLLGDLLPDMLSKRRKRRIKKKHVPEQSPQS